MRTRWIVWTSILAIATPALGRAQTNPCAASACSIVFDWGNGGTAPDVDRTYGSPSEMEANFASTLTAAGFHLTTAAGQPASLMITMRITPKKNALCDSMPGVNPDYTCQSIDRASIVFTPMDSTQKGFSRIDVSPRCSDPKNLPTYAQFGRYAADYLIYTIVQNGKGSRPSVKCA
jgi:hypothetical protein